MKPTLALHKLIFATLICLLCSELIQAQTSLHRFKSAGAITGYGFGENTNTRYQPIFFAGDFSYQFNNKVKKDFLAWYIEPQFNLVLTNKPLDYEFGTNLGLRNYIRINPNFYFYQMIGSGPHYISATVERQAQGYIFSDNLAIGSYSRINKKSLFLNLQFRLRHISNAGLKRPNGGINTFNILVGLAKFK
jgi:hypothetical protein